MMVEHEVELRVIGGPPPVQEGPRGDRARDGEEQHGTEGVELLKSKNSDRNIGADGHEDDEYLLPSLRAAPERAL